jgi:hypothetical protein
MTQAAALYLLCPATNHFLPLCKCRQCKQHVGIMMLDNGEPVVNCEILEERK